MRSRKLLDDPEALRALYHDDKLSMAKIAKMFGCSAALVSIRMREYGIESRSLSEAYSYDESRRKYPAPGPGVEPPLCDCHGEPMRPVYDRRTWECRGGMSVKGSDQWKNKIADGLRKYPAPGPGVEPPLCDCHGEPMREHKQSWRCNKRVAELAKARRRARGVSEAGSDAHREKMRAAAYNRGAMPEETKSKISDSFKAGRFVYVLKDPREEPGSKWAIRYVGRSGKPRQRLRTHISHARSGGQQPVCFWIRELIALGLEPEMEVVSGDGVYGEMRAVVKLKNRGYELLNAATTR
jgi:hypothetical protein